MKSMSFDEWTDELAAYREKKILKHNDDQLYLVCGDEGTHKSTFSIATTAEVYRKSGLLMHDYNICFKREEWVKANLEAATVRLFEEPPEYVRNIMLEFKLDEAKIRETLKTARFQQGDILIDDEGGTEAYARESMKDTNIMFIKTMIRNRFLGLMHFINVPKPESVDAYIRRHRTKMLIWCDAVYTKDLERRIRKVYVYPRELYVKILYSPQWWLTFASTRTLITKFKPAFIIEDLPDLRKYIPQEIQVYYRAKKAAYLIKTLTEQQENGRKPTNYLELMVQPGESKEDWIGRTKKSPRSYELYSRTHTPETPIKKNRIKKEV